MSYKTIARAIIRDVAGAYGIEPEDIRSATRTARVSDARAVVCLLLYAYLDLSGNEVAPLVGRTHAAVIYLADKARNFFVQPKSYKREIELIDKLVERYGLAD